MEKLEIPMHGLMEILSDICDLVETDFAAEMEMRLMPGSKPYTQSEASEMAKDIAKIYSLAHQIYCQACRENYLIEKANAHKKPAKDGKHERVPKVPLGSPKSSKG